MEPDNPRPLGLVLEMAPHRVSEFLLKGLEVIGLAEDRHAQRPCGIPAFWSFFDYEDDLVHVTTSSVGADGFIVLRGA